MTLSGIGEVKGEERQTAGWIEKVRLYPGDLSIEAKLDTGAKSASVGVDSMHQFERNGEPWVRFSLRNDADDVVWLEHQVVRMVTIKRAGCEKQDRPVIRLGVCLGSSLEYTQVNLADRTRMKFGMLIGRRFLRKRFLVNPGAKKLTEPRCATEPAL